MSVLHSPVLRRLGLTAVLLLGSAATLGAQASGTVRGRAVDDASKRPVADVQVQIAGSTAGALTNVNGEYVILNVPTGPATVTARRLGYSRSARPVTVPAGASATADFELRASASSLDAVVVTGTAGAAEKRTIGNAITQLDVADLSNKSTMMNVTDVLQSKTPGITVSPGSGTPGTAADITLRGYSSFTSNRPVIYIDGIKMSSDDLGNFPTAGASNVAQSGQRASALDIINPSDIESIEVIKGPAASTLYGADAAGGVIQIITKKGQRGQQKSQWSTRYEVGRNRWGVDDITNYTTCTTFRINDRDAVGQPTWIGCQGKTANEVITDTPLSRDPLALRDGGLTRLSMSLRGGGNTFSYYIAADGDHDEGVLFNSVNHRRSIRSNFSFSPIPVADVQVNVGYVRQNLRLPLGDESFNGLLLSAARGRPGQSKVRDALIGWGSVEPALANTYNNTTATDRLILGTTVNYSPIPWFRSRATVGLDLVNSLAQALSVPGQIDVPSGYVAQRQPTTKTLSLDYSGSVIKGATDALQSTTSFGTQMTTNRSTSITATGTGLGAEDVTTIGSAVVTTGSNAFSEFNTVGFYLQEQLGWRNRLFVTVAGRNDNHSSFGQNFKHIIYPKASLSWVASEEPSLKNLFDRFHSENFRVRLAYGLAGRAPSPYAASPTYTIDRVALGTTVGGAIRTSSYGNPDLKPEKGTELEGGFDAEFFKGRAGLEVTGYRKEMRDLLVPLALPPSTGYTGSRLQNLGASRNSGLEAAISVTPVDMPRVTWDARLNGFFNKNVLLSLDTLRSSELPTGQVYSPGMQRNQVDYPLGAWFVRFPLRDANGNYVLNAASTAPIYEDSARFVGPPTPTRQFSLANTVTLFKNWRLYALFDYQGGQYLFNYKEFNRCFTANPNCELMNRATPAGVTVDTMKVVYGHSSAQALYLEKADFTKLRDLSLTYVVPTDLARRLRVEAASFTVLGHNLATFTDYSGLDPEVNGYSNGSTRGLSQFTRVDAYPMPQTRRVTFAVNLTY